MHQAHPIPSWSTATTPISSQFFANQAQLAARNKPCWQPYSQSTSTLPTPNITTNTPKPSSQPPPVTLYPDIPQMSSLKPRKINPYNLMCPEFALSLIGLLASLHLAICLILIWCLSRSSCLTFGVLRTFLWPSWTHLQPLHVSTSAEATSSLLLLKNFVHEVLNPGLPDQPYRPHSVISRQSAQRFLTSCDENCGLQCYLMLESTILPATKAGPQIDATTRRGSVNQIW